MAKDMTDTAGLLGEVAHPGRPKDEEPHIKRSVKKKQEVIDYLVRVDLEELGIDESNFEVGNQRGLSLSRNSKRCSECLTTTKTGFFPSKSSKKYLLCWEDQVSLMYNSEQEKEKSEMKKNCARVVGGCRAGGEKYICRPNRA